MCATRMLCWFRFRAYTCGAAASSALRPVPTDPNPAASSASRVAVMPAAPLSRLWLDAVEQPSQPVAFRACLLYTSDAADEEDSVDLGGRRIINKKKRQR